MYNDDQCIFVSDVVTTTTTYSPDPAEVGRSRVPLKEILPNNSEFLIVLGKCQAAQSDLSKDWDVIELNCI